jgi:hypothetical protein
MMTKLNDASKDWICCCDLATCVVAFHEKHIFVSSSPAERNTSLKSNLMEHEV